LRQKVDFGILRGKKIRRGGRRFLQGVFAISRVFWLVNRGEFVVIECKNVERCTVFSGHEKYATFSNFIFGRCSDLDEF